MSSTTAVVAGRELSFTCHSGLREGRGLPNSLEAIHDCLEAGVFRIEIDIHSMADGDYLVSHASRLEESTTSQGPVGHLTRDDALNLRRSDDPNSRPPLLSEVIALVQPHSSDLQLDLKDWRPLTEERVHALIALTEPLGQRVLVSSGQDWNLRAINSQSKELRLGFDPDHYLASGQRKVPVPARLGAYGYRDDHPLAIGRAQPVAEYLRERMIDLVTQCPFAREFFIEYQLLLQAMNDGVSLSQLLHERGVAVSAWTLDYDGANSIAKLEALAAAGVDRITANTSQQFLGALSG
jgi:glycerophosphoryl diester phosphodiesterase